MKHVFASLVLVSLVVIVAAALLHVLPTLADGELLQNHDFEQGLTGWQTYKADFSLVSSPVHNGSLAAAVTTSQQEGKLFQKDIDVVPGGSYMLLGYVVKNNPDIERVFLRVFWHDESGYELSSQDSSWLTSDNPGYRLLTVNGVAPLKANEAIVVVVIDQSSPDTPVTVYVDDMSFVCTSPGPTPSPTPSPAPTVTPMPTPPPTPTATPTPTPTPTLESTPLPTLA
ncbi:carbohydrate binding domain-containing protein, partial [Chloroflexota bacterium]